MTEPMSKADRESLIRINRARAKQAEREADARAKILQAEVMNDITAEYNAQDALWRDAVNIARDYVAKANAQITVRCAELGIPPHHAPTLSTGWLPRSPEFADRNRRAEVRQLAEARIAALTQDAKAAIQGNALNVEERLILDGLQSDEAKRILAALPTVEQLMPPLSIESLGVDRWQPPEDGGARLLTAMTPADRRRRKVLRAIARHPDASDRTIAAIARVDHKTVAAARRSGETAGELVSVQGGIGGEFPTEADDLDDEDDEDDEP
jgi:hypothetical protein